MLKEIPFSEQYAEIMRSVLSDVLKGRSYWDNAIKEYLPNHLMDNFTDFSDSTCFTYFIACDGAQYAVGTKELSSYLKEGNDAYYVKMQISLRAPVMCVAFCKYEKSPHAFCSCEEPFTAMQQDVYYSIRKFAADYHISVAKMSELHSLTATISEETENAYDYLFEKDA